MAVLAKSFLSFMRRYFMTLSFFTTRHNKNIYINDEIKLITAGFTFFGIFFCFCCFAGAFESLGNETDSPVIVRFGRQYLLQSADSLFVLPGLECQPRQCHEYRCLPRRLLIHFDQHKRSFHRHICRRVFCIAQSDIHFVCNDCRVDRIGIFKSMNRVVGTKLFDHRIGSIGNTFKKSSSCH